MFVIVNGLKSSIETPDDKEPQPVCAGFVFYNQNVSLFLPSLD